MLAAGDEGFARAPGGRRRCNVALAVLGLPGEALAHGVHGDQVAEFLQRRSLARLPLALDELHDPHWHAMAERAQHHPERGGGFSLALAGVDDEQSLLDRLGGDDLVARRLLLAHLLGVAGVDVGGTALAHSAASRRAPMSSPRRS